MSIGLLDILLGHRTTVLLLIGHNNFSVPLGQSIGINK
jgi:hypothetical protein